MEACRPYDWMHTEKARGYCQSEAEKGGSLGAYPQNNFLGPRALER